MKNPNKKSSYKYAIELHRIKNELVTVRIFNQVAIIEAAEGITVTFENSFSVLLKIINLFEDQHWVYISDRKNSYSLNPNDYKYLNSIPNLRGIAIINYNKNNTASLESRFSKKPFGVFEDIEKAYDWSKNVILNN